MVDHVEAFVTAQASHLRVGWALTEGYSPYPGGGEGWGGNGVGDDLYSYGFDGLHLWSGKISLNSLKEDLQSLVTNTTSLLPALLFRYCGPPGGFAQCTYTGFR